jgi:hypothetical protein
MEFASLEDAFPSSGSEKRRTFRVNDPPLPPTDADRPAVKRMTDVAAMNKDQIPDSLLDESTKFANKPTVMNSLPTAETLTKFKPTNTPSYFGVEPFANPSEDTLSPFLKNTSNPNAFMLENDFAKSFSEGGYMKAAGVDLPVPELRNRWKLMSSDRVESSKVASKSSHFPGMDVGDLQNLRAKIDELMARIDDLENRAAGANPQLEVLTFVMTGLFLMFIVDLAVRKSSGVRMVSVR